MKQHTELNEGDPTAQLLLTTVMFDWDIAQIPSSAVTESEYIVR